jgi:hypothetical protein
VLSPPDDLREDALVAALAREWDLAVTALAYRPVGFGSHHWEAVDTGGTQWFVTADDLETKRHARDERSGSAWRSCAEPECEPEPLDAAYGRLRAALAAAGDLRACGHAYVVAPVPTLAGEPLARVGDRFAVALHPYLAGQSFGWGEFADSEHRAAVVDLLVALHTAPAAARRHARVEDFAIPHRDDLEASLDPAGDVAACGPYARPAAALLAGSAAPIRRLLARHDELAAACRAEPSRMVLTHGEPHPGNTMRTAAGWLLIDWDTALVAPPERDLWGIDPGDGSVLRAYAAATGVRPLPAALELYRIRWDLADIAVEARRFRRPHAGSADDHKSWEVLRGTVAGMAP